MSSQRPAAARRVALLLAATACTTRTLHPCRTARDCPPLSVCRAGRCEVVHLLSIVEPPLDGEVDPRDGPISLAVDASPLLPDSIVLYKDGAPFASFDLPPGRATVAWDPGGEPDGEYTFVARATRGGLGWESEPRRLRVARSTLSGSGRTGG